jgi:hypothetical protein
MDSRQGARSWSLGITVALVFLAAGAAGLAQQPGSTRLAEEHDMRLVGHNDLQARSAYQPVIHKQGARWIAYIGHHGGQRLNPLTGNVEWSGTSVVDVTDPRAPQYLAHIPGASGQAEAGGAQMVRVCDGADLPRGISGGKTYLLRTLGNLAHEIWDVSNPREPAMLTTVLTGLASTHKNWWECKAGIAYLVSDGRPSGWRTNRMTKIYDLADPAHPRFIRDFGLAGQEPGSSGPAPEGVHGPISFRNRVYFAYGTGADGVLQIVDREKLLKGNPRAQDPFGPTVENLVYPQVGRLDMPPEWGGHTSFPVLGIPVPDFAANIKGRQRDVVVLVSESLRNECQEARQLTFLVDVTTESKPFPISTYQVPATPGDFCRRGGRFGPHSSNESFTPIYYGKLVFIAYFNAGVRVVDIRDPFNPREVAFYIPATTSRTDKRCVTVDGSARCQVAIQTNNVEVDDRGFIYLVDRADTGLDIVELTGAARAVANLP